MSVLLARLPHQLIDVLILMESPPPTTGGARDFPSLAFVLYWLLFVVDFGKRQPASFSKTFLS